MIPFITQKQVLDRLAMPAVPEGSNKILDAIMAAYLRVESELDTLFDKGSYTDLFYIDPTMAYSLNCRYKLRLSNGFLRQPPLAGAPAVVVSSGNDTQNFSDFIVLDPTLYKLDALKGILQISDSMKYQHVKVVYDAGFLVVSNVVDNSPPAKIIEAIIAYTPLVMEFSSNAASVGAKLADQNKRSVAIDHFRAILAPLFRGRALTISPI